MNLTEIENLTKKVVETLEMYKFLVKNNIKQWSEKERTTNLYYMSELEMFAVTMITFENDFKQRKECNLNKILTRLRIVKLEDDNKVLKQKDIEDNIKLLKNQLEKMTPSREDSVKVFVFIETLVNAVRKEFMKDKEESVH